MALIFEDVKWENNTAREFLRCKERGALTPYILALFCTY
jgi:hypothetical protein